MIEEVRRFLDLIDRSILPEEERLRALAPVLDRLACAYHNTPPGELEPDVEAPRRANSGGAVARAFPGLGFYPWSDPLKDISNLPMMGDAIDDLEDIRLEMVETLWRWENVGPADAAWYFRFSYEIHWGRHLLDLRSYIHALLFES